MRHLDGLPGPVPAFVFRRRPALGCNPEQDLLQERTVWDTWGSGSFANDDSIDWVWAIECKNGLGAVMHMLNSVVNSNWIDTAEVVAAPPGQSAADRPLETARWIAEHKGLAYRGWLVTRLLS